MVRCIEVKCDVMMDSQMDPWDTQQDGHQNGASPNHRIAAMVRMSTSAACCCTVFRKPLGNSESLVQSTKGKAIKNGLQ